MQLILAISPFIVVAVGALLLMLAEAASRRASGAALGAAVVLGAGALFSVGLWLAGPELWSQATLAPWLVVDRFALFFMAFVCAAGALVALLAGGYLREHGLERGEFYALLLFATLGAMLLSASGDALTVFLSLETMSLGAYALVAFRRGSPRAVEGALKYFLLGSFAAAIFLYGVALLYGATNHTDLEGMGRALAASGARSPLAVLGLVMVLGALLFKVSAVPFHGWTADAYEGAATPVTAFMAVVVKAAAFALLLRVLLTAFAAPEFTSWSAGWPPVLAAVSLLTMTVANLIAGRQESIKRMLAYSSIAHAGILLVGVAVTMRAPGNGTTGVLFYLLTYGVSTIGAFAAFSLCGCNGAEAVSYQDVSGLGRRHPAVGGALAVFVVSLAGIPPTAGFFGKWVLFKTAMDAGFVWLALLALINSVMAAYYYLRVLVFLFMREPAPGAPVARPMRSGYVASVVLVALVGVFLLGIYPAGSIDWAEMASVIPPS